MAVKLSYVRGIAKSEKKVIVLEAKEELKVLKKR